MTEEILDAIRTMSDLCDTVLEAVRMDLIPRDVAKKHLDMYLNEIQNNIERSKNETSVPQEEAEETS